MAWVRNGWHPEAWTWTGAGAPPGADCTERLRTSTRLRWLAPVGQCPPEGWHLQRRTILARVAVERRSGLPSLGPWRLERPGPGLLVRLHRHYARCHRANPLRRLDPEERRELFASIDLCAVRRDSGRMVAAVTLHDEGSVLAAGWTFGLAESRLPGLAPLLHAAAARRGARWIGLEVDSDDRSALALSRAFPRQRREVWYTWVKARPDAVP